MSGDNEALKAQTTYLSKYGTIAISLVALLISIWSLYFAHLREPNIKVHASEVFYVKDNEFSDSESKGKEYYTELHVPIVFTNEGAKMGIIRNIGLLIEKQQEGSKRFLEIFRFDRLDEAETFVTESAPGPVPIDGRAMESRFIRFSTIRANPMFRAFPVAGIYKISVLIWVPPNDEPRTAETFSVEITDDHLKKFYMQQTKMTTDTAWVYKNRTQKWKTGPLSQ